jgi:hypothetical protein
MLFSWHNCVKIDQKLSLPTIPIKLTVSSKLAILAATFAAHQSLYSSFSICISGAGDSGLSFLTDPYEYLSRMRSPITVILDIINK